MEKLKLSEEFQRLFNIKIGYIGKIYDYGSKDYIRFIRSEEGIGIKIIYDKLISSNEILYLYYKNENYIRFMKLLLISDKITDLDHEFLHIESMDDVPIIVLTRKAIDKVSDIFNNYSLFINSCIRER